MKEIICAENQLGWEVLMDCQYLINTGHTPLRKCITSATSLGGGLGWIRGQLFARSNYGPHHGSGLPTRLSVVSSLSLKAALGRIARPPLAASFKTYPIQR